MDTHVYNIHQKTFNHLRDENIKVFIPKQKEIVEIGDDVIFMEITTMKEVEGELYSGLWFTGKVITAIITDINQNELQDVNSTMVGISIRIIGMDSNVIDLVT